MGSRGRRRDLLLCLVMGLLTALSFTSANGEDNSGGVAVCFAIDVSSSIGSSNLDGVKSFVTGMINKVNTVAPGEHTAHNRLAVQHL